MRGRDQVCRVGGQALSRNRLRDTQLHNSSLWTQKVLRMRATLQRLHGSVRRPAPEHAEPMSQPTGAEIARKTKSQPVPQTHFASEQEEGLDDGLKTPAIEAHHVHDVYDRVASQWAGTRYKAWPEVERVMQAHSRKGDLVGEIGCGNGKNLREAVRVTESPIVIASDISMPLCEISALQTPLADVHAADIIQLPLRSNIFDLVLCVAVLHHLSTVKRRQIAISECARILRPGGTVLFFAWAQEQDDGFSGHEFQAQDVFVPFHQKTYMHGWEKAFLPKHIDESISHGVIDESKRSVVLQRYCHVFVKGELEALIETVIGMRIISSFRDAGNWAVVAEKSSSAG